MEKLNKKQRKISFLESGTNTAQITEMLDRADAHVFPSVKERGKTKQALSKKLRFIISCINPDVPDEILLKAQRQSIAALKGA
ncbi:MAG TPA: hypothetical protein VM658_13065 [bacterium]|nr:hypothetical protein [bacterium]